MKHSPLIIAVAAGLVASLVANAAPTFERNAFSLAQGIRGVDALDANGDGRHDFLLAGRRSNNAVCYRQLSAPTR